MLMFLILVALGFTRGDIFIKSLADTTIYAENLGTTKLHHQTWKLIMGIDTSGIDDRFHQILENYDKASGLCIHCMEEIELKALRNRMNRLQDLKVTLKQVLGINRSKRGVLRYF